MYRHHTANITFLYSALINPTYKLTDKERDDPNSKRFLYRNITAEKDKKAESLHQWPEKQIGIEEELLQPTGDRTLEQATGAS